MADSRRIHNLGPEVTLQYEEGRSILDSTPLKEGSTVTQLTQIDISKPAYTPEFDLVFGEVKKRQTWALFSDPNGFETQRKNFFSYQLIPNLGSTDKIETSLHRVKEIQISPPLQEDILPWEAELNQKETLVEQEILSKLLNTINELERILLDINAGRTKYQKDNYESS